MKIVEPVDAEFLRPVPRSPRPTARDETGVTATVRHDEGDRRTRNIARAGHGFAREERVVVAADAERRNFDTRQVFDCARSRVVIFNACESVERSSKAPVEFVEA